MRVLDHDMLKVGPRDTMIVGLVPAWVRALQVTERALGFYLLAALGETRQVIGEDHPNLKLDLAAMSPDERIRVAEILQRVLRQVKG